MTDGMGLIQLVPGGAKIGIGGVGLFRNKRPYIWIEEDTGRITALGTLSTSVTPAQFWALLEKVIGKPIVEGVED